MRWYFTKLHSSAERIHVCVRVRERGKSSEWTKSSQAEPRRTKKADAPLAGLGLDHELTLRVDRGWFARHGEEEEEE